MSARTKLAVVHVSRPRSCYPFGGMKIPINELCLTAKGITYLSRFFFPVSRVWLDWLTSSLLAISSTHPRPLRSILQTRDPIRKQAAAAVDSFSSRKNDHVSRSVIIDRFLARCVTDSLVFARRRGPLPLSPSPPRLDLSSPIN